VIRDPDDEDQYRRDNGEIGIRIYSAFHKSQIYEQDKFLVLQILRQWTSGGTADHHVDTTNDVQEGWNNLVHCYEGIDARGAYIQKARKAIEEAKWEKNERNKTFDNYCTKIQKANNELNRYKANVEPASQLLTFLKGLRADGRVNPHLLSVKTTIMTNDVLKENLEKAITAFKDTMRQLMNTSSNRDQRQISAAHEQYGGQHGGNQSLDYQLRNYQVRGNYQGRGHDSGRHRGRNRGGRFGNRNAGRGEGERHTKKPRDVLTRVQKLYDPRPKRNPKRS
jgi:hypothetical protein